MSTFGKLSIPWNPKGSTVLVDLRGGAKAMQSQAALRVLLALAVVEHRPSHYERVSTLDELEGITGMSRKLVVAGIRRACEANLIAYAPGGPRRPSSFTLVHPGGDQFTKVPVALIRQRLREMPRRGAGYLVALKLYLLLLSQRKNGPDVRLSHVAMREKAGCQPREVRRGLSLLAQAGLIRIYEEGMNEPGTRDHLPTLYRLMGEFADRPRMTPAAPQTSISL